MIQYEGCGRRTEDRYGDMVVDVMNARNGVWRGTVQYMSQVDRRVDVWRACMDVWMWMAEGRRGGVGVAFKQGRTEEMDMEMDMDMEMRWR